ncbi:mannitol dehydrogenase family protein [Paenibacillus macerans]|uniref:mannitol dehydrogenase family protein n=1 Tax=Paenibacillus macerans TaxID=44252 RepID=UPI003D31ABD9
MTVLGASHVKTQPEAFTQAGIRLPGFDIERIARNTMEAPVWVHFGAGNLFKGYHSVLQQRLIQAKAADKGIIVVETFDEEIIDKVYHPYDNLGLLVVMKADGSLQQEVIASVVESIYADSGNASAWERLKAIFRNSSLQMVTFSITEKGYNLKDMNGGLREAIIRELEQGLARPEHAMIKLTALLHERYRNGRQPLALVSTDNFSHNGDKLKEAVLTVAEQWAKRGFVDEGFIPYLTDESKITFPWSMIDKITPHPSARVQAQLREAGFESADIVRTQKNTVTAPFVNTEECEYLVIEDSFPNGRPALEKAGVYFTRREIVDQVEKMKVCTCLNPLHTSLAIFGCLLGYASISEEMNDADLRALVTKIGYDEGMPVVTNPGIIDPLEFIHEVIDKRLPNPNIPDTPQRIASDTSQKLKIRFGETIKLYAEREDLEVRQLELIPLTIAAWIRYLLGIDDQGQAFAISPDPLLAELQQQLGALRYGEPESVGNTLRPVLSNETIFGMDLYAAGLGDKIERQVRGLVSGDGAVRNALKAHLALSQEING